MHEKWATPDEVRDAAGGVAQNTLWRWVRLGLLPKPTLVSGGPGKGTRNRWPREALERARFVVELRPGADPAHVDRVLKSNTDLRTVYRSLLHPAGQARRRPSSNTG